VVGDLCLDTRWYHGSGGGGRDSSDGGGSSCYGI